MHGIYLVLLGRAPKGNQVEGHYGIEQQELSLSLDQWTTRRATAVALTPLQAKFLCNGRTATTTPNLEKSKLKTEAKRPFSSQRSWVA